jgi:hypothetical protein
MMSVDINADFSKQTPGIRNCRITATLDDGKTAVAHRKVTMAEIEAGTPDDVLERKFERLLRVFMPPDARRRLIDACWSLDRLPQAGAVVDHTLF